MKTTDEYMALAEAELALIEDDGYPVHATRAQVFAQLAGITAGRKLTELGQQALDAEEARLNPKPIVTTKDRIEMGRELVALVKESVTGAKGPEQAAQFVVNSLTVHNTDVLVRAAAIFGADES